MKERGQVWAIWGAKGIGFALVGVAVAAVAPLIAPEGLRSEAPDGMVWIPGGGFLRDSDGSVESLCGNPNIVKDSPAVHRVVVDGLKLSIPTADGVPGRFQPLLGRSQCGSTCSPS